MPPTPSPEYRTVTPYLKLPNSGRLVEFLKTAFGATEKARLLKPDGTLLHAELFIGDTLLMIHELPPESTPKPGTLYLRVANTDATFQQAIAAGATPIFQPTDMYYGERVACVTDVSQNDWWIAAPVENLSLDEIQTRAAEFIHARTKIHSDTVGHCKTNSHTGLSSQLK
jgi:PhnB protein